MELRQLRYFVAVAETGNISTAAKKIFLTQPALSRQIKALEEEIGQCLLERRAHSVHLTPVGEGLLREARELLHHADQVLERVRNAGKNIRLRVGYAPSLATGLLSTAVSNFTKEHTNAKVELFDLATNEMLSGIKNNQLDLIITVNPENTKHGITWTSLVLTSWRLAVPPQHPFANLQTLTPQQIAREPLLAYCQRDYPEYWTAITRWLNAHQLHPKIASEYDGGESLMTAVESNMGVALVTTRTQNLFPNRAKFIQVSPEPTPLNIAVGYHTEREDQPIISNFVEHLRRAASALG